MRIRNAGVGISMLFFSGVLFAGGQTRASLSAKYQRIEAYEVRPGILATATFSRDGHACDLTLEKRHSSKEDIDLRSTIPRPLLTALLIELVPLNLRGKLLNPDSQLLGETTIFGQLEERNYNYQKVNIDVIGNISDASESGDEVAIIHWKRSGCPVA